MGTVSSSIRLNDGVTSVLGSMNRAMNLFTAGLVAAKSAMSANVNTVMFDGAISASKSAVAQMALVEQQAKQTKAATQAAFQWQPTSQMNVFQNTGLARLGQETQDAATKLNQLSTIQHKINLQAATSHILPPQASTELEQAQVKLSVLMQSMANLKNQDMSIFNTNQVATMNSAFEQMRQKQFNLTQTMSSMQNNFKVGNLSALNADMGNFTRQIQQAEMHARSMTDYMKQIKSFQWGSGDKFQVVQSSGMTRTRQELASMQQMTQQLIQRQEVLAARTSAMKLLPSSALNDINQVNSRIAGLKTTLQTLERQKTRVQRFDPSSINQYNARIENIRRQLSSIILEQQQWNAATRANNAEQLNESYKRMKNLINQIEGDIRDNTGQQNQFNNALNTGVGHAGLLKNQIASIAGRIKSMIGMYVSLQGIKMAVGAADSYVNNTARLGLINDGLQTQLELQNQIYASSLRARSSYNDTVNVVAKLGMLAKDSFGSTQEVINFSELMNKAFKLSGASTMERTSAMYQLTQAMAAGKLQGDEFRSIMENAPLLADYIAKYTGNTKGELKDMSRDGAITANIIKESLFSAAEEIEERYAQMPMTFSDIMTQVGSTATMIFRPVMEQFSGFLNNGNMAGIMTTVAGVFNEIALHVGIIGSHIALFAESSAQGLSVIAGGFLEVGRYIVSADGLMGSFFRTATKLANNVGVQKFFSALAQGALLAAQGVGFVIEAVGMFSGVLPIVAGAIVAFTTYSLVVKAVTTIMVLAKPAIIAVNTVMESMAIITGKATAAQLGLNAAMAAFPGGAVAGAIMTVVAAISALLAGIIAVNKAAGLTANNPGIGGYDNNTWAMSEKTGYNPATSKALIDSENKYNKTKQGLAEELNKNQKIINDVERNGKSIKYDFTRKVKYEEAKKYTTETYKTEFERNEKYYRQERIGIIKQDTALKMVESSLAGLKNSAVAPDIGVTSGGGSPNIDSVGNVGSVDKINDTVDITSEDLRYMREAAEREAINLFTQNAIAPQIHITFGDVRETADVDQVIKRITGELNEAIATSANVVPVI